jgi:hypothetical protein
VEYAAVAESYINEKKHFFIFSRKYCPTTGGKEEYSPLNLKTSLSSKCYTPYPPQ